MLRAASPRRPGRPRALPSAAGVLVLALLVCAVLALVPASAYAHGALQRSAPAKGAHLSEAPRELRLTFNEAVELAVARLQLLAPDSAAVDLGPLALAADSARVLVAPIRGGLVAGTYTVAWQVAGADGHPVRGTYTFVIAPGARGLAGPLAPGAAPPPVSHHDAVAMPTGGGFDAGSPLYVAVRWLTYLALTGVIGAAAFRYAVLPLTARRRTPAALAVVQPAARRAARLGLAAAALVGVAALLRLGAQSYALHGAARVADPALLGAMLTRTLWGWGWLLQAGGTLLALAGFAAARRGHAAARAPVRPPAPPPVGVGPEGAAVQVEEPETPPAPPRAEPFPAGWALASAGALALAVAPALSGHAAAVPRMGGLAILADAVHVLGAGGWIGGLLLVLAAGIPAAMRLDEGQRGPAVAALVGAFSPTALLFAGALTGTGLFAAWLHLGSIPALWESAYGRTLLLKLAVLSAVFGTGAYNWLKVKPALGDERAAGRLRRSATVEVAVGVLVLLVTAVLVATAPPVGVR
jgi:putative copper export protein/methionine-rich copper-binding protein CopC